MKAVNSVFIASLLSLPIVMGVAPEAKADLIVCSTSPYKAYVAKAWYSGGRWLASGWTQVYSDQCEVVLVGDMRKTSAYIYVANENWEPWRLPKNQRSIFCLQQSRFRINNANRKCSLGMIPKTFYRVVSPGSYDYKLRLR